MNTDDSAEKVRRRMAELRRELECDVRQVGRSAHMMTDWTFYMRKYPWAVAAVAVAAGYMLVPKKKADIVRPDPEILAQWIKEQKLNLDSVAARPEKSSVIKSLAMMGVAWAARNGIAYIKPPCFHWALRPRSSFRFDPLPTLRSNDSP